MAERVIQLRRLAWRAWAGARWRLVGRRQVTRPRVRQVGGLHVMVLPGVLDPAAFGSSALLAEALMAVVRTGDQVLDLGTGCGTGALAAVRAGAARVVATDRDVAAVRSARASIAMAGLEDRVAVRPGDLFGPVAGERFDLVAFNPPWLPSPPAGPLAGALARETGVPTRFATQLGDHLKPDGRALVVLSDRGGADAWLDPLRAAGYRLERRIARDIGTEVLVAWVAAPAP